MRSVLLLFCFLIGTTLAQAQVTLDSTSLQVDTVVTGLDIPWEIHYGADDHLWVTERYGRVTRINPNNGNLQVLLDHTSDVYQVKESGMLGLVLHPDFNNQPYVYIAYTYLQGFSIWERLTRWEYTGGQLVNETVLIDNIPANETHDGSRLLILPDETLLMPTGDAQNTANSQNVSNLSGKVLRVNLDGTVPADNPIPGSFVWSWGHRNPQGMVLGGPNQELYTTEHGPQTDDEFNRMLPGRNYGWPAVHGYCDSPTEIQFCNDSGVVEPIFSWTPTIAISDLVWYDHPSIPEWQNSFLITSLKDQRLYQVRVAPDGITYESQEEYFNFNWGRLRDITVAPDGRVFLATNGPSWTNTEPNTHSIIVLSNEVTSRAEYQLESTAIRVFPNPSTGQLRVQGMHQENRELRFMGMDGKLLRSALLPSGSEVVSLEGLPFGMLLMEVRSASTTRVVKVLHQQR
ncbi:MAG: PQQ-dependent sugar dehydrogenase [Salibacteraceae bacterium]